MFSIIFYIQGEKNRLHVRVEVWESFANHFPILLLEEAVVDERST